MALLENISLESTLSEMPVNEYKEMLSEVFESSFINNLQEDNFESAALLEDQKFQLQGLTRIVDDISSELEEDDISKIREFEIFEDIRDILMDIKESKKMEQADVTPDDEEGGGFLATVFGLGGMIAAYMSNLIGKIKSSFALVTGKVSKLLKGLTNFILKPFRAIMNSKVIQMIVKPFKTIFGWFGKIFSPFTKLLPVVAGGSKILKFIPIVGQVIGAIVGIFDFFSGWANAADISGKKEEMVTLGDKILAGVANMIDSFAFLVNWIPGISLDTKNIFSFLDNTITKFFDVVIGFFENPFGFLLKGLDYLQTEYSGAWDIVASVPEKIGNIIDGIMDFFANIIKSIENFSVKDFLPKSLTESSIGKSIFGFFTGDNKDETSDTEKIVQGTTIPMPMSSSGTTIRESKEKLIEREKVVVQQQQQVAPVMPPMPQQSETPTRTILSIDDLGLNLLNTAMVE